MFSTEAKEKAIRIATKITDLLIGELVLEEDISPSQRFAEMIDCIGNEEVIHN